MARTTRSHDQASAEGAPACRHIFRSDTHAIRARRRVRASDGACCVLSWKLGESLRLGEAGILVAASAAAQATDDGSVRSPRRRGYAAMGIANPGSAGRFDWSLLASTRHLRPRCKRDAVAPDGRW